MLTAQVRNPQILLKDMAEETDLYAKAGTLGGEPSEASHQLACGVRQETA